MERVFNPYAHMQSKSTFSAVKNSPNPYSSRSEAPAGSQGSPGSSNEGPESPRGRFPGSENGHPGVLNQVPGAILGPNSRQKLVSATPIFISFTVTGDNGDMGQGNVSLPRNYETKEHVSWSEIGILTPCSKKLWSHENSNLGFKEIMKRENHGIPCRG